MVILSSDVNGRGSPSQKSSSRNCRAESGKEGSSSSRKACSRLVLPTLFSPTTTRSVPRSTSRSWKFRKFLIVKCDSRIGEPKTWTKRGSAVKPTSDAEIIRQFQSGVFCVWLSAGCQWLMAGRRPRDAHPDAAVCERAAHTRRHGHHHARILPPSNFAGS